MNNSENAKKLPLYAKFMMIIFILSIPLAVFRGVILFKYTDISNGLINNADAGNIFFVLLFLLIAATVCLYFPISKSESTINFEGKHMAIGKILNILCAVLLLSAFVWDVYAVISDKAVFSYLAGAKDLLCALSAICFLYIAFKNGNKVNGNIMLIPAVYIALYAIIMFIDINTQINASQRSYTLLMLMFVMMSFVSRAEIFVPLTKAEKEGNLIQKSKAKYVVFSVVATVLAVVVAVPHIAYSIFITQDMGALVYSLSNFALALINGVSAINFLCDTKSS